MTTAEGDINEVLRSMPAATPQRSQIALELRGHIAERMAAGQPIDEVVRQLGSPVALAESVPERRAARRASALETVRREARGLLRGVSRARAVRVARLGHVPRGRSDVEFPAAARHRGRFCSVRSARCWARPGSAETFGKWLFGLWAAAPARTHRARKTSRQSSSSRCRSFPWMRAFVFFTEKQQRAFELLSKTRVVTVSAEHEA